MQTLNILQLTMREGQLALKQQAGSASTPQSVFTESDPSHKLVQLLKSLLVEEAAEVMLLVYIQDTTEIRVNLSEQRIEWAAKAPQGLQRFQYVFSDRVLHYNGRVVDMSFWPAFAKKIESFLQEFQRGRVRLFIKPLERK